MNGFTTKLSFVCNVIFFIGVFWIYMEALDSNLQTTTKLLICFSIFTLQSYLLGDIFEFLGRKRK